MKTTYTQCELKRTVELGQPLVSTVTYIPTKYAKIGKFVELRDNKVWNTWQVTTVSSADPISEEQAKRLSERQHKGWGSLDMPRRRGK